MKYKYATLEGDAVLLGDFEAWVYRNGAWSEMSNAEAFTKASLIDHPKFLNMYGRIEQSLPEGAFTKTSD